MGCHRFFNFLGRYRLGMNAGGGLGSPQHPHHVPPIFLKLQAKVFLFWVAVGRTYRKKTLKLKANILLQNSESGESALGHPPGLAYLYS